MAAQSGPESLGKTAGLFATSTRRNLYWYVERTYEYVSMTNGRPACAKPLRRRRERRWPTFQLSLIIIPVFYSQS